MKKWRRIVLWAVLLGVVLLIVLSVIGTLLQTKEQSAAERAKVMFNSAPLVAYWMVLTGLLVVGFVFFRRLRRSFGLLIVHLGCVLVLLGAMCGSVGGHEFAAKYFGQRKIPFGYMIIHEGQARHDVYRTSRFQERIGSLPFSIGLRDFRIEYYELDEPWKLVIERKQPVTDKQGRPALKVDTKIVEFSGDEGAKIPFTDATVEILERIEKARPTYDADAGPTLMITAPDGSKTPVSVEVGAKKSFSNPDMEMRIVKAFGNLRVHRSEKGMEVVDVPGPANNPALQISISHAGHKEESHYVYARSDAHGQHTGYKFEYYVGGLPVGAESDPKSSVPAMKVLLKSGDREQTDWLIPVRGMRADLPLGGLLAKEVDHAKEGHEFELGYTLFLGKFQGQVRDYKSDLGVTEERELWAEKTIEVNDPLHYGGYHLYQSSYDDKAGKYTILAVASDSGLTAVYIGFALTGLGVFWLFWGKPVLAYLTKRRNNGN